MFSTYVLGLDGCLWKINLGIFWNHTMKNFYVKHGQCDSIIFSETFSLGRSKYLLELPLGYNKILLTVPRIYPQIYHRNLWPALLICKGI